MKNKKYPLLLMAGHLCTDINQGALPAILPFLIAAKGLTYAEAGGLMLAASGVSSVIQPFLGYLADKKSTPLFMVIGILMAGLGFSLVGLTDSYPIMFGFIVITGIGVALFHPEGGRMINSVARERKGEAFGIFSVGGKLGFAIGPVMVATIIPLAGMKGTLFFLIPPVIMACVLLYYNKALSEISNKEKLERKNKEIKEKDDFRGFAIVTASVFGTSIVNAGIFTFLPLFWVTILMQSEPTGSSTVTVLSIIGAIAAYSGGRLADNFGFKKMIFFTNLCIAPVVLMMAFSGSVMYATLLLIPLGIVLSFASSPSVSLGQQLMPNHVGMASGITLGLSVSIGGIAAPILGMIGDKWGLVTVMIVLSGAGLLVAGVSAFIPKK